MSHLANVPEYAILINIDYCLAKSIFDFDIKRAIYIKNLMSQLANLLEPTI